MITSLIILVVLAYLPWRFFRSRYGQIELEVKKIEQESLTVSDCFKKRRDLLTSILTVAQSNVSAKAVCIKKN